MTFHIETSQRGGVLCVLLSGQSTVTNAFAIAHAVIKAAKEARTDRVLIDICALKGRITLPGFVRLVEQYAPLAPRAQVAVVDLPENWELSSFHSMASTNRGVPVRYFTTVEEALSWLDNGDVHKKTGEAD